MSARINMATPATALCSEPAHLLADVIQRSKCQVGLCDNADVPLPTRRLAENVAVEEAHAPQWARQ
jgi:hypothetical protein